jgi:hypothetical protein
LKAQPYQTGFERGPPNWGLGVGADILTSLKLSCVETPETGRTWPKNRQKSHKRIIRKRRRKYLYYNLILYIVRALEKHETSL